MLFVTKFVEYSCINLLEFLVEKSILCKMPILIPTYFFHINCIYVCTCIHENLQGRKFFYTFIKIYKLNVEHCP